ncbi:hypothetical protein [Dyadobacter sp. LHD-138]|uniref:hypothetical protein n=1 Tax=Dyadobacter sp. LHD-138 TaxID=3071413 RepID=UPI0027E0B661|nr:hypothetical protein [Dyadobacter sp. LHD-138]MDQ6481097.1 hypothetical protein [Dyadobacter sp. LHD-138]
MTKYLIVLLLAAGWKKATIRFLTDARYAVFYDGPATIEPHANSLKSKGRIYVSSSWQLAICD